MPSLYKAATLAFEATPQAFFVQAIRANDALTLQTKLRALFASDPLPPGGAAVRSLQIVSADDGATWLALVTYVPQAAADAADVPFNQTPGPLSQNAKIGLRQMTDPAREFAIQYAEIMLDPTIVAPAGFANFVQETLIAGGGAGHVWMLGLLVNQIGLPP